MFGSQTACTYPTTAKKLIPELVGTMQIPPAYETIVATPKNTIKKKIMASLFCKVNTKTSTTQEKPNQWKSACK